MTLFELRLFSILQNAAGVCRGVQGADGGPTQDALQDGEEIFSQTRAEEREAFGMPSHEGGMARLAILACCAWSQAQRVKGNGWANVPPRRALDAGRSRDPVGQTPRLGG